ncbi:MAG TPA: type II CAAX endopeptidase family protein [Acidobacteriota bacterium]|nr:type II CAAX endopeptidase family protein [Acidobacteriota bacterium]
MDLTVLLDPMAVCLLLLLALVFPWGGVRDFRRLIRWDAENRPDARLRHYNSIAVWEWISAAVFLAWWFWSGRPQEPLRLVHRPMGWEWLAVAAGLVLSALLVLQMSKATRNPQSLSNLGGNLGNLKPMIPRNSKEQSAFNMLSVTAGICEEILYRGVLLAVLAAAIGTWPAVVVSSAVFGLGHLYQGLPGVLRTGAVGLVFALLTVFSGSLLTAVILHITMDVTSGRIMAEAIKAEESAGAAAGA